MKSVRLLRIENEMTREVSDIILTRLRDPRLGMVTVTGVSVSPDLSVADVYVSVLGDESARKGTLAALGSASAFIRREVGGKIRLRTLPELRFHYDPSAERGERMDKILKDLHDHP